MKLKLKSFRKRTMTSLVVLNPAGGAVRWQKVGDSVEVKDPEFAYKLLSEYGDMLEEEKAATPAPENKAVDASKMKTKSK